MQNEGKRKRPTSDEIQMAIDQYVLNERHRQILRRRLIDHPTFESIAEETGLDVSTVKRITYQYRDILGEYM